MDSQLIALAGRNPQTEAWLRAVLSASALPTNGLVRYRHWDSAVEADVDFEAGRMANPAPNLLVAKSIGTVIAARAFSDHGFRPRSAVFIGTPYNAMAPRDRVGLKQLADGANTLFIQQTDDPGGAASSIAAVLELQTVQVVAVPGNDHLYTDVAGLANIIQAWIAKAP